MSHLTYATILTLVMVPVMFYLVKRTKYWLRDRKLNKEVVLIEELVKD